MMAGLVLSLFPGIGLLDMAFEEEEAQRLAHAWAAGLFDGEGCVSIAKARQGHAGRTLYYRVDLIVSNTRRELLAPFVVLFGGRIDHHRKNSPRRQDSFQWKTTGSAHAAEVLTAIRPWLIAKRENAEVALSACALLTRKGGTRPPAEIAALEELKQRMHGLNRRGHA
jgi:hypothetical protein